MLLQAIPAFLIMPYNQLLPIFARDILKAGPEGRRPVRELKERVQKPAGSSVPSVSCSEWPSVTWKK